MICSITYDEQLQQKRGCHASLGLSVLIRIFKKHARGIRMISLHTC